MFYCDTNANRGDSSLFLIAIRDRYLLIPVNPWHVLYSNPDIALCGPDLCSSVMWLRVMIRDRIFFFLRSPRIPSALEKEGEEEGIVARKDRFRNVSGWAMTRNWTGNRSVSRAIIPRTSGGFAGEIFHRNVCTRGKNSKNRILGYKVWLYVSLYIKWFANYLKTLNRGSYAGFLETELLL